MFYHLYKRHIFSWLFTCVEYIIHCSFLQTSRFLHIKIYGLTVKACEWKSCKRSEIFFYCCFCSIFFYRRHIWEVNCWQYGFFNRRLSVNTHIYKCVYVYIAQLFIVSIICYCYFNKWYIRYLVTSLCVRLAIALKFIMMRYYCSSDCYCCCFTTL